MVAMDGRQVLEAAGACEALLNGAIDQDWTRPIPDLEWTVAEAVTHVAEGTLWYATDLAAGPRELSTMDLRVKPETPPERQVDWRWHCAPLEEWDGLNPSRRH
jgi:hypothetical protein